MSRLRKTMLVPNEQVTNGNANSMYERDLSKKEKFCPYAKEPFGAVAPPENKKVKAEVKTEVKTEMSYWKIILILIIVVALLYVLFMKFSR